MANCHLCWERLGADLTKLSAERMKVAVAAGLRPRAAGADSVLADAFGVAGPRTMDLWASVADAHSARWIVCPSCADRVESEFPLGHGVLLTTRYSSPWEAPLFLCVWPVTATLAAVIGFGPASLVTLAFFLHSVLGSVLAAALWPLLQVVASEPAMVELVAGRFEDVGRLRRIRRGLFACEATSSALFSLATVGIVSGGGLSAGAQGWVSSLAVGLAVAFGWGLWKRGSAPSVSPRAPRRIQTTFEFVDDASRVAVVDSPPEALDDMEYLDDPSLEVDDDPPSAAVVELAAAVGPRTPSEVLLARMSDLQAGLEQRSMLAAIAAAGKSGLVWGLIAVVMGFLSLQASGENIVLVGIGAFLVIEGLWLSSNPQPAGLVADGLALLMLGAWNGYVATSGGGAGFVGVLGLFQIVWGLGSFVKYAAFSEKWETSRNSPETQALLASFDALQTTLQNASPSSEARLIEFHTAGGLGDPIGGKRWRGLLDGSAAALRADQSPEVVFQPIKELAIQLEEPYRPEKSLKASIKIGAAEMKGKIDARSYDRWKAWSS